MRRIRKQEEEEEEEEEQEEDDDDDDDDDDDAAAADDDDDDGGGGGGGDDDETNDDDDQAEGGKHVAAHSPAWTHRGRISRALLRRRKFNKGVHMCQPKICLHCGGPPISQILPSAVHSNLRIPCVCWSSNPCPASCNPRKRTFQPTVI